DGTELWLERSITAVRDIDGRVAFLIGNFRDVTDRVRAENALQARERHFEALVRHSTDVITVADADGTLRWVSPSSRDVFGWDPQELVADNAWHKTHPDDLEAASKAFEYVLGAPGRRSQLQLRMKHRDGRWYTHHLTFTNLLDEPAVGGIVCNSKDVTAVVA